MPVQPGVYPIKTEEYPQVVAVWEASVRATHHFVSEGDIQRFRPLVEQALPRMTGLACLRDSNDQIVASSAWRAATSTCCSSTPPGAARAAGGGCSTTP